MPMLKKFALLVKLRIDLGQRHINISQRSVIQSREQQKLSKQTKSVSKKNDTVCNEKASNVFRKKREQYFEIQDLKAQLQDKNIAVIDSNHFACVTKMLNDAHARTKKPNVVPISTIKTKSQANKSIATPNKKKVASKSTNQKPQSYFRVLYENTNKAWKWWIERQSPSGYKWVSKPKMQWIVQLILFIVDSGCTKHMTSNLKLLCNFVEKFLGTVRFGNDQFAPILGYGDLVQGNVMINRVYYVEGLNHNLFSVGQFCDADLEVAFRKSTCFVRDLQGNDLLIGNRGSDLYTISLQESTSSTPLCLMKDIVIGLPKLKYVKDQICSSSEQSKAKRISFKLKVVSSSEGRLNLLHVDLCGPMWVASINEKKCILVIIDDYSRYTWTLFLRSKDETPEVLKEFLTMIQRNLQGPVITVHTDRGTEDGENLDKIKEKGDQYILVGYSTQSKGYRVYNNRTRMIVKSIHIRFDEIKEVSKTSVANNTSGLVPQQQKASDYDNPDPSTSARSTHTNVHAEENNNDQAKEGEQLQDDEFTNPFFAPALEEAESSSHNIENPSRLVQTRRQLAIDPEMCMYTLTVSTTEPKNIKEAMADSAWIEAMQEVLHQFDRLQVWELVDKPFGKSIIRLKWLWKNKKDEDQTVIHNKARLVAKGYAEEEDADHAGCIDSRKSTSGGIQFVGDKLVSWMSKKHNCITMSSAEAKYVALSARCAQSAIEISCNPVQHSRTKHIHTQYHFIKEQVENGIIELYFVRTEYQLADMFTKALPEDRFKYLVRRIGMRCLTPAELEVLAKEST
uniref:Integrase catalytic domain-containing protein n=1 Tax=Tanacetum cinerariifolium TaxID=118510 RepID=A0A6L2MGX8_TANCI|nr:hypothetical protein [Tanacetum cinerariifolium]